MHTLLFIYKIEYDHLHIVCQDQGMTKWDRYWFNKENKGKESFQCMSKWDNSCNLEVIQFRSREGGKERTKQHIKITTPPKRLGGASGQINKHTNTT